MNPFATAAETAAAVRNKTISARELVELTGIHVVTTLMARSAFPDDHAICNAHGTAVAGAAAAAEEDTSPR